MISVVIRAEHGVEALAFTLSALVSGAADGLVGDAIVVASRPDDALAHVADAVGATFVIGQGDPWTCGALAAKRNWVLCLNDGDVPVEGWFGGLEHFIALSPPDHGFGRLVRRGSPWRRWLNHFFGSKQVQAGDLMRREILIHGGSRLKRPARVQATIERDPRLGLT
jgi:hypothetical protein